MATSDLNRRSLLAAAELAGVELGHDVVDVEDDLRPAQLCQRRGKHLESGTECTWISS